jgi:predicted  nucleic acid-binding Zn-ribbon protein
MASQQPPKGSALQKAEEEIQRVKEEIHKAKQEIRELLKEVQAGTLDEKDLETGLKEIEKRLEAMSFWEHGPE